MNASPSVLDSQRSGYALLAVLWMTVGVTALAFLITVTARGAIATSRNRIALTVAGWHAAACAAHARAVVVEALRVEAPFENHPVTRAWDEVDRILRVSPPPHDLRCEIIARAVGSRLDVNAADSSTLAQLFRYTGMSEGRAESTATKIVRHKPYVDRRALRVVPGLESVTVLDSVLGVEPGPISIDQAPGPVLALLPGFTERTVAEVLDARARHEPIASYYELSKLLSPDAPGASTQLPAVSVFQAGAWVLTVRARSGEPPVTAVIELRLGPRASVASSRSWIE